MTLIDRLTDLRTRLIDSGKWDNVSSDVVEATIVGEAIDRIRDLEAREATWNMRHARETAIADKACARISELESLPQRNWRPFSDIPEGEMVLGYWDNGEMHVGMSCEDTWCPAWSADTGNWSMPSRWMSLPDEPSPKP